MKREPSPSSHDIFWPVVLISASIMLVLIWEIRVNILDRQFALETQERQTRQVEQSKKTQDGLEKLVRGLVELSKTDEEASKLVNKYQIKLKNPSPPAVSPSP